MRVSQKDWKRYIERLSAINQKAADEMQEYIRVNGFDDMESLVRYAYALTTKYGEASAALACQMYDAMAILEGVNVDYAIPAEVADFNTVAKNMYGVFKKSQELVAPTVGRLVKQTGQDTILRNARRDGAYFAWIAVGETCPYCLMISSNGWREANNKTVGAHADHIHANCDCSYQVKFRKDTTVEGYHPDRMLRIFQSLDEKSWKDKVNALRRIDYAIKKEESTED